MMLPATATACRYQRLSRLSGVAGVSGREALRGALLRALSSSSGKGQQQQQQHVAELEPVYIHPISQLALSHLQQHGQDWLVHKNLRYLKLHRDGTFLLSSNVNVPSEATEAATAIWTCFDQVEKKHWLYYSCQKNHQIRHPFLLKDITIPASTRSRPTTTTSTTATTTKDASTSAAFSSSYQVHKSIRELLQRAKELEEECKE